MPQITMGGKVVTVNPKLAAALVKMGKAEYVTKDEQPEPVKDEVPQAEAKPKRSYSRKDMRAE